MRPLIVTEEVRAACAEIKEYAALHMMSLAEVVRSANKPECAAGNDPRLRLVIPFGYRLVYSQEQQTVGQCAHLSVSVDSPFPDGKAAAPSHEALLLIMSLFGMPSTFKECVNISLEDIQYGGLVAVNIISLIS